MTDSLAKLIELMRVHGANRFYAKYLSPNDNSKNQVYFGGDFSALNIFPHGDVFSDETNIAGAKRDRLKAGLDFSWVDETGLYKAPEANLILYPKYPEIRLSGFLKGCKEAPSHIMSVRDEGRVLFLGVTPGRRIIAFASFADSPLVHELRYMHNLENIGVFCEISLQSNTRHQLLCALKTIWERRWIDSQKLGKDSLKHAYSARNGGGYTLEAELGISPNGYSEPDFLGWEIKQYSVSNFIKYKAKSPVTLMTPEPSGGIYRLQGVSIFMEKFGYDDKSGIENRRNFGGIYACNKGFHTGTGLKLELRGYDPQSGKIEDVSGGIFLVNTDGEVAAMWSFPKILEHWNRKHAKAAYIPSIYQNPPPQYAFGQKILLCENTDFSLFLNGLAQSSVYYDPGIKIENLGMINETSKKRSQFRIHHDNLTAMYKSHEYVDLGAC